jgi:hypothetical protein
MNPLRRFLEWRRELLTPEHVEKATRMERWKRSAWMLVSTFVTIGLATGLAVLAASAGAPIGFVWVPALVAAFVLDVYVVFPWGVERFDLVHPWQFRDAEAEECETA